ncbi:hypothetical protein ABKV19_017356 [Rosa sericea]
MSLKEVSKFFHIKWQPPDHSQVKLNFDGSFRHGVATIGFLLRNSDGNPLFAACRNLGNTNALVAEATALRDGLYTALLHQYQRVIVEGDSKLLLDCITLRYAVPWRIGLLIWLIILYSESFCLVLLSSHVCVPSVPLGSAG